ncbi:PocR ligand-binding domain-containing protein [Acetobacterium sp. KB-1]|jgi:ligand-binding sensor protein/AraC-like DNA-binding protein|uniref:PocR ligand-binding domain-containing protein n=1 Tax=Acetobacterium sp. KB-1 TaxID=2184575 RepID=UPI000DBEB4BE|nr:PocR ligand-binding domain-containing protein [Acetobacterium sp. KB-1]AWW26182.1 AraC family transcriptional regulator [Acetobacterium sp. KB-1]
MDQSETLQPTQKRLSDLVDIKTLQEILDAFTTTTGLMANIVDGEGVSIFPRKGIKKCCKFCRIIYSLEGGKNRCQAAYKRAGKQAALFGEPYIFRCPSGLIEWAAPIVLNGEHVGTIICGQVLMWEPEEFFWIELRKMNQAITDDFEELFEAVGELAIVTGNQVQASAYLLYVVANYIMKAGWENFEQSREFARQRTLYHAEIENHKSREEQADKSDRRSLLDEDEIIVQLQQNRKKAKAYLEGLISGLRYEAHQNLAQLRAKMTELLVVLSRVVNRIGLAMAPFLHINDQAIGQIYQTTSQENISVITSKAVDAYLEQLEAAAVKPENPNISLMTDYIDKHYPDNLTVEAIADAACLSPGYAGRIFKEQLGLSIMDYVLKVRIDKSKKLLLNPHYQIQAIAEKVGYGDAGYFTKVFRKFEGITPTQFRKIHKR